jgi:hypothetical protein
MESNNCLAVAGKQSWFFPRGWQQTVRKKTALSERTERGG